MNLAEQMYIKACENTHEIPYELIKRIDYEAGKGNKKLICHHELYPLACKNIKAIKLNGFKVIEKGCYDTLIISWDKSKESD